MSEEDYGSFDEEDAVEVVASSLFTPERQVLRQKTLFGGLAQVQVTRGAASYSATRVRQRNREEPETHHRLDPEAIKTWIFPTNYAQRDYQFNMIRKALFTNVLVALPTGLGKTFIAAVVMYNWYRWAPDSKIIFLAPAKPLVTQQIEACYHVCGIPAGQTAELTGGIDKARRQAAYDERRVFFLTPQTFQNDLHNGLIKAKDVSCLVVDEAHHATGNYAYVNVVKQMRRETDSFRILALTATPGKSVETVQEVIDGLNISQIEIRNESSIDIRSYTHTKEIETILLDLSPPMLSIQNKFASLLKPMVQKLIGFGVGMTSDPTKLSAFGINQAVNKLQKESHAGRGGNAKAAWVIGGILSSLAYNMELLNTHGIRPFYDAMSEFKDSVKSSQNKKNIVQHESFRLMMKEMEDLMQDPQYTGHPKLDHLAGLILSHFQKAEEEGNAETRVMIFSSLRVSAEAIVNVLKLHSPMVKPTPFFGQQAGKSGSGMSQKEQQETITKFKQGHFNVIVATSVGEEGLDIGEVDMIICYDSSSSPARMLQRMGRTGRKRDGQVFVLCVRGKEEMSFIKAKDAHKVMQKKIEQGIDIKLSENVHRIIPWNINPECEKRLLEIPAGDKSSDRELISAARKRKAAAKRFHMPEGVETGFVSAGTGLAGTKRKRTPAKPKALVDDELWNFDAPTNGQLLNAADEDELDRRFRNIDEDHQGCLRLQREEEGQFLTRDEIRSIGASVLLRHGQVTNTVKELLHKYFDSNALFHSARSWREQIDAGIPSMTEQDVFTQNEPAMEVIPESDEDRPMEEAADFAVGNDSPDRAVMDDSDSNHDCATRSATPPRRRRLSSFRSPVSRTAIQLISDSDSDTIVRQDKIRLSQLARESDDDDLPDARHALESALIASSRKGFKEKVRKSATTARVHGKNKIRIVEDDEDDW